MLPAATFSSGAVFSNRPADCGRRNPSDEEEAEMNDAEQKLHDLAPLMRDTILAWEASINAMTREETEDLYIKAAHLRKQVVGALKNIPGGGGTVEESGITLPSAAAEDTLIDEFNERMRLGFDIGKARPDNPIKGQDGLPCDKSGITDGIIDGFAQPLPNLDHLINRRVPPPFMTAEQMGAFLANAVPAPSIDDDLDDVRLGKACSLDGDSCESCQ